MSSATTEKAPTAFESEVVTRSIVQDVTLPGGAGTLALVTLDNGFDHTKPNTFGPATLVQLQAVVDGLHARAEAGEIAAVGITGKPFIFAVGADLTGVPHVSQREQAVEIARAGHRAFASIMDLPVPTFGFVNGAAMGGGVEIALACDYRTISGGVPAVALPECFLGLVPGWGGCYLLPRLLGAPKALKVIIENPLSMNRMLKGVEAYQLGIADAIFEPADFLEDSLRWAADVVSGQVTITRPDRTQDAAEWDAACDAAGKLADAKTARRSPAPYRAIDLVRAARTSSRDDAFAAEDAALGDLLMGDELRAGLYAFDLVQRRAKRPAGAPDRALARKVTKVGIVGAGLMASQLAMLFARSLGVPVVMTDLDADRVAKGVGYVHGEVDGLLAKGRIGQDKANFLKGLVTGSTSKDGFADADFVIEAVFEEMAVKQQVFAEVEAVVSSECVLATNTSSLSITQMASGLEHPERVVGFHFFNPVAVMPLLEIIPGEKTDDATLATAFATGKGLKKTTILVKDSASFITNRLLGRFMGEFSRIVDEGTPVQVADRAVAGLAPMPPFVLMGLVGPAIALHNSQTLVRAFGDRFYASPSLEAMVAARKPGYYTVVDGVQVPDPEVLAMQVTPEHPVELTVPQVRERVLSAIADEVARMLDEKVAQAPMDIDLAMITGAGFQFWNGGIIPLLDREGISQKVVGHRFLPPGVASVPS
ncbi:MAG TPA: 3-hydroxyacyl-CoA dehydrogenase NAD-binding domain-containing protein [Phycicoccus elongatus]|uniref:3-hydroxyacyl-CoA dehydrogenase NAD-binding domain-containing protein n=1 Tax=Phycicoccus TaxID=367298 RepID=UPI0025900F36|nr:MULTISPECIES: 3-hydroxyacyl-CoA dehydrogenase NAD-binding domain-containing protein [Phycicoccus]MCB9405656.1 enoyl-CoA hydratase/isomerase family protein [Tetrasphaera sp.]MCO5303105.1 3-hydroxyacyl-CoA dehydrogenase NAD-binding domain-containing protein [Phycicoccus sp.]HPK11692.1 3-hydroxyacyl-CoA dehydrogenase NAD-binding domain-containing protein [Phycicoccus elongatus]